MIEVYLVEAVLQNADGGRQIANLTLFAEQVLRFIHLSVHTGPYQQREDALSGLQAALR